MHFTIIRDVQDKNGHIPGMGLMSVDNETVMLDASALDPNISIVTWAGNRGLIQYNDRPEVRRPVTDIAPYQPWVNRFMRVVADGDPELTLDQAKQLKIDLVEALYDNKREVPFIHAGREYECSDEAIAYMSSALAVVTNDMIVTNIAGGLVPAINAAFTTLTAGINTSIVALNNVSAGTVNGWSAVHAQNWSYVTVATVITPTTGTLGWAGDAPHRAPGSGGFLTMGALTAPAVNWSPTALGNVIPWQPLNSNVVVNIPFDVFREALRGIIDRRNAINLARRNHKREINLLATVAAIIAYDTTTGWPV